MVECPRACGRAQNCDVCNGAGEVEEHVVELLAVGADPTVRMTAEQLEQLRASSRPPPPLESAELDDVDVPDEEPTKPETPFARRNA